MIIFCATLYAMCSRLVASWSIGMLPSWLHWDMGACCRYPEAPTATDLPSGRPTARQLGCSPCGPVDLCLGPVLVGRMHLPWSHWKYPTLCMCMFGPPGYRPAQSLRRTQPGTYRRLHDWYLRNSRCSRWPVSGKWARRVLDALGSRVADAIGSTH